MSRTFPQRSTSLSGHSGWKRGFLHEGEDYGELITGETRLAFSSKKLMRQLGKNPASPKAGAPTFEIAFEVVDVRSSLDRAIAAGATMVQEVREEPWG